jgi:hypothetical protein
MQKAMEILGTHKSSRHMGLDEEDAREEPGDQQT